MILGALHDAADRGVHIRLLVDGMESWIDMEGNPYFYGLSSHENVEIKLYNKANPLKPWKMMGRMHDKYLIADGKRYILGEEIHTIISWVIFRDIRTMTETC